MEQKDKVKNNNNKQMILYGEDNPMIPIGTFTGTSPFEIKEKITNAIKKLLNQDIDESDIELEFFDYPVYNEIPGISWEEIVAFKAFYKNDQICLTDLFKLIYEVHNVSYIGYLNHDVPPAKEYGDINRWNVFKKHNLKTKEDFIIFVVV